MTSIESHESPLPRPRGSLARTLLVLGAGALLGVGGTLLFRRPAALSSDPAMDAQKQRYQCPMHPQVIQDHPGDCPICSMKLVPVAEAVKGGGADKIAFYRNPMDPSVHSPEPMKDGMGMAYIPVFESELKGDGPQVEGLATVKIDPERQQLIGLRTAEATLGPVGGEWRTVGRVAVDETRVHKVNVKVEGFVEKLFVDFMGKPVAKGQALLTLYSPDLLSAQNEYLLALKTQQALSGSSVTGSSGADLVSAARQRLRLWDIPESTIEALEKTGQPTKTLTLYSPASGVVTAKNIVQGARLNPGDTPFEITDLSQVWVLADVYEGDLANVRTGMTAAFTTEAMPNRTFTGKVSFLDPQLDPRTRTAKVRVALPNPKGELRPEIFGDVVFQGQARKGLRVPQDAVVDSGTRKVVFVALGEGKFQPREVQLGAASAGQVEVRSGLKPGDQVVVRANFLIDSESRLRSALQALGGKP